MKSRNQEYPELPKPAARYLSYSRNGDLYTVEQMREYVDADRAMRAAPAEPAHQDAEDAARFRWLTDDHPEAHVRDRIRLICERLPVMGYGAVCAAIDTARANQESKP